MIQKVPDPPLCEVIILTALPIECQAVLRHIQEPQEVVHPSGTIYYRGTFLGKHSTWRVAVAEIGMGGVPAALEAEKAISFFCARIALFVGIAGGLKDVRRGDVVVATKVYAYEGGKNAQRFEPRPELGHPSHALEQRARAEAHHNEWQARLAGSRPDPAPQVFIGALAAGEKVLASKQSSLFRFLKKNYGDALAIEMEGHGFLHAVRVNHTVHGLVIRGISDLIDDKAAADTSGGQVVAAQHAAAFAFQILAKFTLSAFDDTSSPSASLVVWNAPSARNPFFTGRETLLDHLHANLKAGYATALSQPRVISGLGGIGKTQIAIEYAYRHIQDYLLIGWVRAEHRELLNADLASLAVLLDLPEQHEENQGKIVSAVQRWLAAHDRWLLIFDNIDDPTLVHDFLSLMHGHILLTTRAHSLGGLAQHLEVGVLDNVTGASLLLRRAALLSLDAPFEASLETDRKLALKLSEILGGLPLALDQAAAYIEETGCGFARYIELYEQCRTNLLQHRGEHVTDHPDSVATTFTLSFARVEQRNPAAADLLRVCIFLHAEAIPEEFFIQSAEQLGRRLAIFASKPLAFDQACAALLSLSLINRRSADHTISLHRLVQAVLYDNMKKRQRTQWLIRVLDALWAVFPDGDYENWEQCERLLPHVLACIAHVATNAEGNQTADLLSRAGRYLQNRDQDREAEPLLLRAVRYWERVLGLGYPIHHIVADALNELAHVYGNLGRYEEAERFYRRALRCWERGAGDKHPHVAIILSHLADLYHLLGRYEKAELFYQRAISIREQALGPDHPTMARLLGNVAEFYRVQGHYAKAEPLYQRALHIYEQVSGPGHPDVALALTDLARLYDSQGRYEKVEPLLLRALNIHERALGADHPDVATSLNSLAKFYNDQGRNEEAEPLYQRALHIYEQALGMENPYVATLLNNLANLYDDQGRDEEAEWFYQRALHIYEQAFGPEHPQLAHILKNFALLYQKQSRYEKAEPLYQRALSIREQVLGPEHPDVAFSLNLLGNLYYMQGRNEQAKPLYQRCMLIMEKALGPQHPNTRTARQLYADLLREMGCDDEAATLEDRNAQQAKYERAELLDRRDHTNDIQAYGAEHSGVVTELNNLASLYINQGKYEQAEPLLERALAVHEEQLGHEHPDIVLSLNNLAGLYQEQGKYEQAEPLYQRAITIDETVVGSEHSDSALLSNLADLYVAQGKYEQAEPLYQRALAIDEQRLGSEHPDIANAINSLGMFYYVQSKYEQAEPLYQRALAINKQKLGHEHSNTALILNNLGMLYLKQGKYEQAEPLLQQGLVIWKRNLGLEHPLTGRIFSNLGMLYLKQGKYEQAEPLLQQGLTIRERVLGLEHLDTLITLEMYIYLLIKTGRHLEAAALEAQKKAT